VPTKPGFIKETSQLITKACAAQTARSGARTAAVNKTSGNTAGIEIVNPKKQTQNAIFLAIDKFEIKILSEGLE